jgi:thiamine biosynthesis lipoprotein
VSLGGDIATAGPAPAGGWQVHVQDCADDPATQVSLPAGAAIATSSTVGRSWRRGGRVLHHIVDPATGQPAAPVWRSVTVAAGSCAHANTVTTAAVVRGRAAVEWVQRLGLPARFLDADGRVHLTDGWPQEVAA